MRQRAIVLLTILLATTAIACGVPRSITSLVKPRRVAEFYRVEGVVCSLPEMVVDEQGIVMGRRFAFAELGYSCTTDARDVFVSVGREQALKRAEKLKISQRISLTGTLEGEGKETVIAVRVTPHRR